MELEDNGIGDVIEGEDQWELVLFSLGVIIHISNMYSGVWERILLRSEG